MPWYGVINGREELVPAEWLHPGWKPTLFNFKRDAKGKPARDARGKIIVTTPKMQDKGRLCPNLELLNGDVARQIVRWLSLSNRANILNGWMNDPRLQIDGRLCAGSSGIASTHRQTHSKIVNVPKADPTVILGAEMRDLFRARDGHVLVGFDASALEARVEAHYCYPYSGGAEYAHELLEGDIHIKTVERVFFEQIKHLLGTEDFHKDYPEVKPLRNKAKAIKYSTSYGASPGKVAETIGVSKEEGQEVYDAFWESALPLKQLKEKLSQVWSTAGQKKWIKAIDGRRLYSRSEHSLVNLLFQSCGAIAMDIAGIFMNKWLGGIKIGLDGTPAYLYKGYSVIRVIYSHDEYVFDCAPEIADEVAALGLKAIAKAGEFLKLRVPLCGEAKIGATWKDIH